MSLKYEAQIRDPGAEMHIFNSDGMNFVNEVAKQKK